MKTILRSLVFSATIFSASQILAQTLEYDLSSAAITGSGQNTYAASTTHAGGQGGVFTSATLPSHLVFSNGASANLSGDYFIGTFSSVALAGIGDKLTLNFTLTSANFANIGQTLRFGLYNIGSATTGSQTPTSNSFASATGYRADYGSSSAVNGIRERTGTNDNLFSTGAAPLVGAQSSSDFTFMPADSGTYSGSLTLELLSGGQVQITSQIGSTASISVIDAASAFTTFNSFAFFEASNGSRASMDFTALSVTYMAIPEPGSVWLLLVSGLVGLGLMRIRRAICVE